VPDNMIRMPFIYYNPEKLSKIIREGGLADSSVVYTTEDYTTPKKGFKLHPAHSQHARGKAHKPLYLSRFDEPVTVLKDEMKNDPKLTYPPPISFGNGLFNQLPFNNLLHILAWQEERTNNAR